MLLCFEKINRIWLSNKKNEGGESNICNTDCNMGSVFFSTPFFFFFFFFFKSPYWILLLISGI